MAITRKKNQVQIEKYLNKIQIQHSTISLSCILIYVIGCAFEKNIRAEVLYYYM
jgi:hypothetical protein